MGDMHETVREDARTTLDSLAERVGELNDLHLGSPMRVYLEENHGSVDVAIAIDALTRHMAVVTPRVVDQVCQVLAAPAGEARMRLASFIGPVPKGLAEALEELTGLRGW